jgi:hypothetical protein
MPDDESWKSFIYSPFVCDGLNRTNHPVLEQRPPIQRTERLAFPHPNSLKRSALLVDRIYLPCWANLDYVQDVPLELTFGDPSVDHETAEKSWMAAEVFWPWKIEDPTAKANELLNIHLRDPLVRYRAGFPDASMVPVNYGLDTPMLPSGTGEAFQAVLNNVPVVVEEQLTWAQVCEFREDADARRKFRDLHLWLDGLNAQSERHATDLIAQKIDDYGAAIRKHGLSTRIEAVSSFLSLSAVVAGGGRSSGAGDAARTGVGRSGRRRARRRRRGRLGGEADARSRGRQARAAPRDRVPLRSSAARGRGRAVMAESDTPLRAE